MAFFNAQHDLSALTAQLQADPDALLIACFCAEWCKTCQQYQPTFEALATQFPDACLIWIDIEEQPELVGDEDIEDFCKRDKYDSCKELIEAIEKWDFNKYNS